MPETEALLTCEYCCNTPATQVFSADVFKLGRHTTFTCAACGDEQEHHVLRLRGQVWRYEITPIKETARA
jgi:hypothetical protein